jgi:hypothetical protein
MDYLDLLRALIARQAIAPASAARLAPHELRFVLEFGERPELPTIVAGLAALFGPDTFIAERLSDDGVLDRFVLARFPQVERTVPPRELFAIAYALGAALQAQGCEPEVGADCFADPNAPVNDPAVESADFFKGVCWAPGAPPASLVWALDNIAVRQAWASARGSGIVVGHLDTGIAQHAEITPDMLDMTRAGNMLEPSQPPTDPLAPGTANPGHGTSTASVIASRLEGKIAGAAPEAMIAPVRCIEDVKVFNAAPVAKAIAHATRQGVHVISLSLGGVPSSALHAAVRQAVEQDIVVVAAAGNCVGLVVWPAAYKEAIAVAGSNDADRPWRGTSKGRSVDITAPAELVWRAARPDAASPSDGISGGQGTSFSAALVAGVAAVWLSHHGRANVIDAARQRNTTVQALFKAAIAATAREPARWDTTNLGRGIINAERLLQLRLADIAVPAASILESASASVERMLGDQFGDGQADASFDWQKFHAEIAGIALAEARATGNLSNLAPEAKKPATRPSALLASSVANSPDPRLRKFGEAVGASVTRPRVARLTPAPAAKLSKVIPRRMGLEATGASVKPEAVADYLAGAGKFIEIKRIESIVRADARLDQGRKNAVMDLAAAAMHEIGTRRGGLSVEGQVGLEALVLLTGRPALRVRNGVVDFKDPRGAEWKDDIIFLSSQPDFAKHLRSVGRIDADGAHIGTGFLVAPGLVMTNRHVLQGFAAPTPRKNNPTNWVLTEPRVTIDFADEPDPAAPDMRFTVESVVGAGDNDIDFSEIDFRKLDAALLRVGQASLTGKPLPPALSLSSESKSVNLQQEVFCVGYPARPSDFPSDSTGEINMDVVHRLAELFGTDFGTKYFAPGRIAKAPGWPGDTQGWVFTHDATTLGGNSGSCVVGTDGKLRVVGLHFGGAWLRENYAHAAPSVRGKAAFIDTSPLTWI